MQEDLKSDCVIKKIFIVPSKNYKVGSCSITHIVGKEKKLIFDSGDAIEVNEEQFETINNLGWCLLEE